MNSGVEALRIAAKPEAICVWPQTISTKGMALLSRPIPKKDAQTRPRGRRSRRSPSTARRISAASTRRDTTTVSTGSSRTATALKKNAPPQIAARRTSIAHSVGVIWRWVTGDILRLRAPG